MRTRHSWSASRNAGAHRFFMGLAVAGSLTLVAFEWRSPRAELVIPRGLPDEGLETEVLPVVILPKTPDPGPQKKTRSTNIVAGDPVVTPDPTPAPSPDPGSGTPSPDPDPRALMAPEPVSTAPMFWANVGVRPYFMECLRNNPLELEPCTEARIDKHLQKEFKIPRSVRGHVRTTVTFVIDTEGRVAKIHCAPKVDADVQAEVERVLRSLPAFVPGSQGGLPVPVYYQIPLSLRNE